MDRPIFGEARSRLKTWLTAGAGTVAAIMVAGLLGAFGSLQKPPAVFPAGRPIETGQWLATPLRAYIVADRIYGVPMKPGQKALVLEAELGNRTARSSKDYFTLFIPVPPPGDPADKPLIALTRDSTLSPELHPGLPERMAFVWPLPAGAAPPKTLMLIVNTQVYKARDNLYGTPGWYNEHELGRVELPVGDGPSTPDKGS
jgi:hypothetical protein